MLSTHVNTTTHVSFTHPRQTHPRSRLPRARAAYAARQILPRRETNTHAQHSHAPSRFRRASSASIAFLNPFLRLSALLPGRNDIASRARELHAFECNQSTRELKRRNVARAPSRAVCSKGKCARTTMCVRAMCARSRAIGDGGGVRRCTRGCGEVSPG